MWYAGEGDLGGSIGYATSLDGRAWTKYVAPGATEPAPVYTPGKLGMADSFRVTQPCVLIANGVYFMWYTADDSNNKRVAYATSTDGLVWDRGGVVFDVGTGNYSEGAFAPAVVRTGLETPDPADDAFHMIFTGNKIVAGSDIQSKLINASSPDGTHLDGRQHRLQRRRRRHRLRRLQRLAAGDPVRPPRRRAPVQDVVRRQQPGRERQLPRPHRSGVPEAAGQRVAVGEGAGSGRRPYWDSMVTLGAQGAAFDSMMVADLRGVAKPVAAGAGVYGFYTGTQRRRLQAAHRRDAVGRRRPRRGPTANAHATLIDAGPSPPSTKAAWPARRPSRTPPAAGGCLTPRSTPPVRRASACTPCPKTWRR